MELIVASQMMLIGNLPSAHSRTRTMLRFQLARNTVARARLVCLKIHLIFETI